MDILQTLNLANLANIPLMLSSITIWEVFDILIVAFALYVIILFVKQTRSYFVLVVSLGLLLLAFIAQNVNLSLTRALVQPISTLTFIIIAIVLQREIRQFFRWVMVGKNFLFGSVKNQVHKTVITEVVDALTYMAEHRIGAIIVFTGQQDIENMLSGGQLLDGRVSKELLLSIFDSSSPGHDGAVIIENGLIKHFGVHLPLAQQYTHFRKAGTRHRAAAGITEGTDAIAFVVSEERGTMSVFAQGQYQTLDTTDALLRELTKVSGEDTNAHMSFWDYFIKENATAKIASLCLACVMWFTLFVQTGIVKKDLEVPVSFQLLAPQYQIVSTSGTNAIIVTLQGKSNDMATLDPTKIQSKVDAKELGIGTHTIPLGPDDITAPSFVTVTNVTPSYVTVTIGEKQQPATPIEALLPSQDE